MKTKEKFMNSSLVFEYYQSFYVVCFSTIDKLLLDKISLRVIARNVSVSTVWL